MKTITRILLALITTLAALLVAPSADAYTHSSTGSPGRVTAYRVQGTHYPVWTPYGTSWSPGLRTPGPTVYRSPATTGAQTVVVIIQVKRWDGYAWRNVQQRTREYTIWTGQSGIRTGDWDLIPTALNRGQWTVSMAIVWGRRSTGAGLGTRTIYMNQQGDYECATTFSTCYAGAGWVNVWKPM